MRRPLVIVGVSTRGAAECAVRSGFQPNCADLFGDLDLRRVADVTQMADFAGELAGWLAALPGIPRMYTGGLENSPQIVELLAEGGPLWGASAEQLNLLRDPQWLSDRLRAGGFPALDVVVVDRLPVDFCRTTAASDWLRKPLKSGGGLRIQRGNDALEAEGHGDAMHGVNPEPGEEERAVKSSRASHYWQKYQPGEPISGMYLGDGEVCRLLGVTRQLVGCSKGCPGEFAYCGSILWPGPPEELLQRLRAIGQELVTFTGLRGLFGIDLILDDQQQAWAIEVNPRFTASMELWERSGGVGLIAAHAAGFEALPDGQSKSNADGISGMTGGRRLFSPVVGKWIHYAPQELVAGDWSPCLETPGRRVPAGSAGDERGGCGWELADLPVRGARFLPGWPVCTSFAEGPTVEECEETLRRQSEQLLPWLQQDGLLCFLDSRGSVG